MAQGVLTKGIFIVAAKRTPFGSMGGKLTNVTATTLQEIAGKAAMAAGNVDPDIIDSVVIGNCTNVSAKDTRLISRHTVLRCGIPLDRPAFTVNRQCGSGFQAVISGMHEILVGASKVVLTGGAENMSLTPFLLRNVRYGTRLGQQYEVEDSLWVGLRDPYCDMAMGQTAENLAEQFKITRHEAEEYALRSQRNWKNAHDNGYFKEEMAPVKLTIKGKEFVMDVDEHPKPNSTKEGMEKLKTVFKENGTVTAATASGINDGAGAVIIASEEALKEYNLTPLARVAGYSAAGVEPTIMGIGPVPTIQRLLKVSGMELKDIDMVEINEAFAPQTLACQKALNLDMNILNVNGGAIAMGHPLAATGARITSHLTHELRRRKAKYGIGSACIGGGQGIAVLLESV